MGWKNEADANEIVSLHVKQEFRSASKLALEQFLALKVIWNFQSNINVLCRKDWAQRLGTNPGAIIDACDNLRVEDAWNEYLKVIPNKRPPNSAISDRLGRFAMVLQNQRIVFELNVAKRDMLKVEGSPMKTRSGLRLGESGHIHGPQWNLEEEHVGGGVDDPQRQGKHPSPARSQSTASSKADTEHSAASFMSWFDDTISKAERAAMADEQVVNTAAISLLQSLFVHGTRTAYWTPQRKGFRFGKTSFKAYTDGHLQIAGESRSAAIVEVKARRRPPTTSKDFKIEWQESAQMALWIREEPSSFWTTEQDPNKCR